MYRRKLQLLSIVFVLLSQQLLAKTSFIRVQRSPENKIISLDTAVVRYQAKESVNDNVSVDLVAALHVADQSYYNQLNTLFENYDAVLYELVAPEGTRVKPGEKQKSAHPVGKIQLGIKDILDLSFQLSHVNYSKQNFIHADMSPDEFSKSMNDRGESFVEMIISMMVQSMLMQGSQSGTGDMQLLFALMSEDRALKLKRIMAVQFENLDMAMVGIEGNKGSTIIAERNKKALKVLRQQMGLKKQKIAIFYGAGHMSDMEKRLIDEFNMHPVEQQWLPAWQLSKTD